MSSHPLSIATAVLGAAAFALLTGAGFYHSLTTTHRLPTLSFNTSDHLNRMIRDGDFERFGPDESIVLVVAAINIHHFVVDAFIWRLRRSEGNRRIVEGEPANATP